MQVFGLRVAGQSCPAGEAGRWKVPGTRRLEYLPGLRVGGSGPPGIFGIFALIQPVFRKSTMRLVLVPLIMLLTPQQFAVLVNFWSLISKRTGSSPAETPQGNTVCSNLVLPP